MNTLFVKGGHGRRLRAAYKLDKNKWDYFLSSNKYKITCKRLLPTTVERGGKDEKSFTYVMCDIYDDTIEEE